MKQILISVLLTLPLAIASSTTATNTTVVMPTMNNTKLHIDSINVAKFKKQHYLENIKEMMPVFQMVSEKAKVPLSIPIVFFAWETGWGKAAAFQNGFNLGGVMNSHQKLVRYSSLYDSAIGWCNVLGHNRYTKHFTKDTTDFKSLLMAYHVGGYWGSNLNEIKWRMDIYNQLKGKI